MTAITWDTAGSHVYHTGVSKGVLYVFDNSTNAYKDGIPWNGLKTVTESPSGAEATSIYADNIKYLTLTSAEEFKVTVEAYTYPDEFAECDGTAQLSKGVLVGQQNRSRFALCYSTILGNDTKGDQYGELIHIVYGAVASPSEKAYATVSDSPDAIAFSWECNTTPVPVPNKKPTSLITLDTTKIDAGKLKAVLDKLYGSATAQPKLLMPNEIAELTK
jgi:hypothetical protein